MQPGEQRSSHLLCQEGVTTLRHCDSLPFSGTQHLNSPLLTLQAPSIICIMYLVNIKYFISTLYTDSVILYQFFLEMDTQHFWFVNQDTNENNRLICLLFALTFTSYRFKEILVSKFHPELLGTNPEKRGHRGVLRTVNQCFRVNFH